MSIEPVNSGAHQCAPLWYAIEMERNEEAASQAGAHRFGQWLSVSEAVTYCSGKGLQRTPKTIRKWANAATHEAEGEGDVTVRRQDTSNNRFRYLIERDSLDLKIAQELELEKHSDAVQTSSHESELGRTRSHESEQVRTGANEELADKDNANGYKNKVEQLEADKLNLTIDNRAKEHVISQMVKEREGFIERIADQGYTIGRLEAERDRLLLEAGDHNSTNAAVAGDALAATRNDSPPHQNLGEGDNSRVPDEGDRVQ